MANACGPCIDSGNVIPMTLHVKFHCHLFNRNFAKRADGNPNTFAFVASPELTMALTIAGDLGFNPLTDTLVKWKRWRVKLTELKGDELPLPVLPGESGCPAFPKEVMQKGYQFLIHSLAALEPFSAPTKAMRFQWTLIKTAVSVPISYFPWLVRGCVSEGISKTFPITCWWERSTPSTVENEQGVQSSSHRLMKPFSGTAKQYKQAGISSISSSRGKLRRDLVGNMRHGNPIWMWKWFWQRALRIHETNLRNRAC